MTYIYIQHALLEQEKPRKSTSDRVVNLGNIATKSPNQENEAQLPAMR